LSKYGLQGRGVEINAAAAVLARRLADQYCAAGHQCFAAGSIGPSGMLPSADAPDLSDHKYNIRTHIIEGLRKA